MVNDDKYKPVKCKICELKLKKEVRWDVRIEKAMVVSKSGVRKGVRKQNLIIGGKLKAAKGSKFESCTIVINDACGTSDDVENNIEVDLYDDAINMFEIGDEVSIGDEGNCVKYGINEHPDGVYHKLFLGNYWKYKIKKLGG